MDVGVDEAGEQGGVAQVDDFGALGMVDRGADGADVVAFDQDFAGLEEGAGIDLEKARGVENDGRGGGLCAKRRPRGRRCAKGNRYERTGKILGMGKLCPIWLGVVESCVRVSIRHGWLGVILKVITPQGLKPALFSLRLCPG